MATSKTPTASNPNNQKVTRSRAPVRRSKADSYKRMTSDQIGTLVRLIALIWSGGLLTLYYLGGFTRMDTTFIGGLLTQTLAGFGIAIQQGKKQDDDHDDHGESDGLKSQAKRSAPSVGK
jgi:hypothetical protein